MVSVSRGKTRVLRIMHYFASRLPRFLPEYELDNGIAQKSVMLINRFVLVLRVRDLYNYHDFTNV